MESNVDAADLVRFEMPARDLLLTESQPETSAMCPPIATADTECPFLDKLPAELRNVIYELTFTADHNTQDQDGTAEVELLKSRPPSKDLLLTCRQIHAEGKGIHRAAFRHYWQTTPFILNTDEHHDSRPAVIKLDRASIDHITNLRIDYHFARDSVASLIATKRDGNFCWRDKRVSGSCLPREYGYLEFSSREKPFKGAFRTVQKEMWYDLPLSRQILQILSGFGGRVVSASGAAERGAWLRQ